MFEEYKGKYGKENVLCFWRSDLYWRIKCLLPFLVYTVISLFVLLFFYNQLGNTYFGYILFSVIIIYLVFFFPIIGKYIDYKMDFIIVIPNAIMLYDQWGIFRRDVVTISSQSIKTISIKKDKFIYSVFDNGDLIILTEWDTEHIGEMILRRIPRPEKRKNQIVKVVGIDLQANQNPKI